MEAYLMDHVIYLHQLAQTKVTKDFSFNMEIARDFFYNMEIMRYQT